MCVCVCVCERERVCVCVYVVYKTCLRSRTIYNHMPVKPNLSANLDQTFRKSNHIQIYQPLRSGRI